MSGGDAMAIKMEPRPRERGPAALLSWLGAFCSFAILATLLIYMHGNDTNHTAFEPWLLSIVFAPTAVFGVAALRWRSSRWGAILACCLGFGGLAFLLYIDAFSVMVQYDRLAARGGL